MIVGTSVILNAFLKLIFNASYFALLGVKPDPTNNEPVPTIPVSIPYLSRYAGTWNGSSMAVLRKVCGTFIDSYRGVSNCIVDLLARPSTNELPNEPIKA